MPKQNSDKWKMKNLEFLNHIKNFTLTKCKHVGKTTINCAHPLHIKLPEFITSNSRPNFFAANIKCPWTSEAFAVGIGITWKFETE